MECLGSHSVFLSERACTSTTVLANSTSFFLQLVFSNFAVTETVHVGFFAERTTCPDGEH